MVTHPMKQGTYQVSSGYGPRWGTFHAGLDFAAPIGTPIYAAADGVVVEGRERYNVSGFGSWIWLDCQDSVGKDFIYGHVKHDGIMVKAGDRVRAGQQIGVVGNEGQSTGPHLHFEVWGAPGRLGGAHQDPAPYLAGAAQPGESVARPVGKQGGTIHGVDVSEHQDGMSLKQAAREGIDFAIVRTTDGTHRDRCYRSHLDDAEAAGLVTAAYHFLRNPSEGTTVAQQVQASLEVMGDKKRPVWIDVETPAGLHVDISASASASLRSAACALSVRIPTSRIGKGVSAHTSQTRTSLGRSGWQPTGRILMARHAVFTPATGTSNGTTHWAIRSPPCGSTAPMLRLLATA